MNKQVIEAVNEAAFEALSQHEVYQAQTLFRQNAKNNPCFMTLNNLGVFHIFEGLLRPDNSGHGATKLGIIYLKKAELLQKSDLTLLAYGWGCFESNRYIEAYEYYRQACELKPSYASLYNAGVSLYMQGMYDDAAVLFQKSLNICDQSDYIDTYLSYMYSLQHSDKIKFHEAFSILLQHDTEDLEWEKLIFAYFCDDLILAERQIKTAFNHNFIDTDVMAIIFDCLFKLKKDDEAMEYLNQQIEILEAYNYNFNPEIIHTKQVFSQTEYREKIIRGFMNPLRLIKQCCYYGCQQHNPL